MHARIDPYVEFLNETERRQIKEKQTKFEQLVINDRSTLPFLAEIYPL